MQKAAKEKQRLFLLHGITGSGKTEVYMRLIKDCVDSGKTAIMMVPEISLTKQIIERFARRFGHEILAVLHSGLTKGQRYDEWQRIKTGQVHKSHFRLFLLLPPHRHRFRQQIPILLYGGQKRHSVDRKSVV